MLINTHQRKTLAKAQLNPQNPISLQRSIFPSWLERLAPNPEVRGSGPGGAQGKSCTPNQPAGEGGKRPGDRPDWEEPDL